MAVPRPVLLALLGLALIASAFLATRGATSEEAVTAPPTTTPAPAPPAKAKSKAADRADRSRADRPDPNHTPARPRPAEKPDVPAGTPAEIAPVVRALARDQVVVLFFTKPGAADDTGTRQAVESLRGMEGVGVFTAGIEQLASYRPILSGVGVSQVPAVVVVAPGRQAKLVEGFVDEQSLRQRVADAVR